MSDDLTAIEAWRATTPGQESDVSASDAQEAYKNDDIVDSADKIDSNDNVLRDAGFDPTDGDVHLTVSDETNQQATEGTDPLTIEDLQVDQGETTEGSNMGFADNTMSAIRNLTTEQKILAASAAIAGLYLGGS